MNNKECTEKSQLNIYVSFLTSKIIINNIKPAELTASVPLDFDKPVPDTDIHAVVIREYVSTVMFGEWQDFPSESESLMFQIMRKVITFEPGTFLALLRTSIALQSNTTFKRTLYAATGCTHAIITSVVMVRPLFQNSIPSPCLNRSKSYSSIKLSCLVLNSDLRLSSNSKNASLPIVLRRTSIELPA